MPIGWAIAGSALIGAAGSITAADTQAGAQKQAAATQQGMFNTITAQEQPFIQPGYAAETSLSQLLGTAPATGKGGTASGTNLPGGYLTQTFNPSDLTQYPGYQFALSQGDQALSNANSPGVGAVSGPALKSLMNYNQGLASQTYQAGFNNFNTSQTNIFNRLNSIAQLGQNAAGNLGNAGTSLGTGIAQAQAAAGGSLAGGIVGATNSASSGLALNYLMNNNNNNSNPFGGSAPGSSSGNAYNTYEGTDGTLGGGQFLSSGEYCDYALKCGIEPYRFNGTSHLMIYDFEFKSEPGVKHRGYIAQEVQAQYPHAVSKGPLGFLKVDYSKLPGWDELDAIAKEPFDG